MKQTAWSNLYTLFKLWFPVSYSDIVGLAACAMPEELGLLSLSISSKIGENEAVFTEEKKLWSAGAVKPCNNAHYLEAYRFFPLLLLSHRLVAMPRDDTSVKCAWTRVKVRTLNALSLANRYLSTRSLWNQVQILKGFDQCNALPEGDSNCPIYWAIGVTPHHCCRLTY